MNYNRNERVNISRPQTKEINRHNLIENNNSSILSQGRINWETKNRPKTQN